MEVYEVVNIEEAFYGCEENTDGARAIVTLKTVSGEVTQAEMTEEWIALSGIDIGKTLVLGDDGKYRVKV